MPPTDYLVQLADSISALILANLSSLGAVQSGSAWTLNGQPLSVVRAYLPMFDLDTLNGIRVSVLPWGDRYRKAAILCPETHADVRLTLQMNMPDPTTINGVTTDPLNDPAVMDPLMAFCGSLEKFLLQAQPEGAVCIGTDRDPAYSTELLHHQREFHAEIKSAWKRIN
jgi:hypothetical protein